MFEDYKTGSGAIIVFDALCVLCSANAQFIISNDKKHHFFLASIQSDMGQALARENGINALDPSSMLVVDGSRALLNSQGVLAIFWGLGWPWRAVCLSGAFPLQWRNRFYSWVAVNRFKWFGKREVCWLPNEKNLERIKK